MLSTKLTLFNQQEMVLSDMWVPAALISSEVIWSWIAFLFLLTTRQIYLCCWGVMILPWPPVCFFIMLSPAELFFNLKIILFDMLITMATRVTLYPTLRHPAIHLWSFTLKLYFTDILKCILIIKKENLELSLLKPTVWFSPLPLKYFFLQLRIRKQHMFKSFDKKPCPTASFTVVFSAIELLSEIQFCINCCSLAFVKKCIMCIWNISFDLNIFESDSWLYHWTYAMCLDVEIKKPLA